MDDDEVEESVPETELPESETGPNAASSSGYGTARKYAVWEQSDHPCGPPSSEDEEQEEEQSPYAARLASFQ